MRSALDLLVLRKTAKVGQSLYNQFNFCILFLNSILTYSRSKKFNVENSRRLLFIYAFKIHVLPIRPKNTIQSINQSIKKNFEANISSSITVFLLLLKIHTVPNKNYNIDFYNIFTRLLIRNG